jgi:hypothetical protein
MAGECSRFPRRGLELGRHVRYLMSGRE